MKLENVMKQNFSSHKFSSVSLSMQEANYTLLVRNFWMSIFSPIGSVHLVAAPQVSAEYADGTKHTEILLRSMKLLCIEGAGNEQQRSPG